MKLVEKMITCSYDSARAASLTTGTTAVSANQEDTGFLAVTLDGDNNDKNDPTPKVKLVASGDEVYGAVATINPNNQTVGVITKGIVPFRADVSYNSPGVTRQTELVASDVGIGVAGSADGRVTRGGVALTGGPPPTASSYTDGTGRGTSIGRLSSGSHHILWVDLSINVNNT